MGPLRASLKAGPTSASGASDGDKDGLSLPRTKQQPQTDQGEIPERRLLEAPDSGLERMGLRENPWAGTQPLVTVGAASDMSVNQPSQNCHQQSPWKREGEVPSQLAVVPATSSHPRTPSWSQFKFSTQGPKFVNRHYAWHLPGKHLLPPPCNPKHRHGTPWV